MRKGIRSLPSALFLYSTLLIKVRSRQAAVTSPVMAISLDVETLQCFRTHSTCECFVLSECALP
jgi:hypothetical protein